MTFSYCGIWRKVSIREIHGEIYSRNGTDVFSGLGTWLGCYRSRYRDRRVLSSRYRVRISSVSLPGPTCSRVSLWCFSFFIVKTVASIVYCYSDVCAGRYHRSCYTIVSDDLTHQNARSRCQSMGGDLVTIGSKAENDVIKGIVAGKFYMIVNLEEGGIWIWHCLFLWYLLGMQLFAST